MGCPKCGNRDPGKARPHNELFQRGRNRKGDTLRLIGSDCLVCGASWEHDEVWSEFDYIPSAGFEPWFDPTHPLNASSD